MDVQKLEKVAYQDKLIEETVKKEEKRLRNFIRKRVSDELEAEDILQDVFYQLTETYRLMKPIERVSSWLFRVTRNKIIDVFRKKKPEPVSKRLMPQNSEGESLSILDLLMSDQDDPEERYMNNILMEEIELALDELPEDQKSVFVKHEMEGKSFKEISAETGIGTNTLLSRKRYAILHLRERLADIYVDFIN